MIERLKLEVGCAWYRAKERALFAFVWALPREVIEIATIRCWANATSGPFGNESPTDTTVVTALKRWDKREGGDRTCANS